MFYFRIMENLSTHESAPLNGIMPNYLLLLIWSMTNKKIGFYNMLFKQLN